MTDEDKLDLSGSRCDPYFKPDWNIDLFRSQNMFSHLGVLATVPAQKEGTVELALAKISSAEKGWRMIPARKGKPAVTHWRKLATESGMTLVEFRPETGRTHQIRVHAREAFGRGIVGDRVYGIPGGPMLLHASRLVVPRERRETIDVTAPLPEHFGEWRPFDTLRTGNAS